MSTVEKTQNYNLTKYVGIKYPLFLKDYSADMTIIDALIKSINDDISEINSVIETVSTQNIDDLMARIMALEVKVDNNANLINGLLNSLNGLGAIVDKHGNSIEQIIADLQSANDEISTLKQKCDNVLSVLAEHGEAITQNTNSINNINNEISRIKLDVIGNAQDIQTLATQLATMFENKQDKLYAGTGIKIENNVISAIGAGVIANYDDGNLILG